MGAAEIGGQDLTGLTPEEREEEVRRIAREEAGTGFDLSRGPLLRVKVLKLEEEEHVLLFTMHHIVSDGWSMGILIREVGALYRAYSAGEASPLGGVADPVCGFRGLAESMVARRSVGETNRILEGATGWLGAVGSDGGPSSAGDAELSRKPSPDLYLWRSDLQASRVEPARGCNDVYDLAGSDQRLMSQYTGQEDIVIGTNIANRNIYELEGIIGFFVNNLVLRTNLSGDPTFRELLSRVRGVALKAHAHQDLPFEKLVEELHPERDLSQMPLFQVAFVLQNTPGESLESAGLSLSAMADDGGTSKFDLTFFMRETSLGLAGVIEYSVDLFDAATIHRMHDHFRLCWLVLLPIRTNTYQITRLFLKVRPMILLVISSRV